MAASSSASAARIRPWRDGGSFPGARSRLAKARSRPSAGSWARSLESRPKIGPAVTRIRHHYRHGGAVDLQFFAVRSFAGEIDNQIYQEVRWVGLEELPAYEFLAADRTLIQDLAAGKLL